MIERPGGLSSAFIAACGKPKQKIVGACARELAGFVTAIATDQPLREGSPSPRRGPSA